MHDTKNDGDAQKLVSNRTMDLVIALLLMTIATVAIVDSLRLGFDWRPNEGPAPGYFPFYMGLILWVSSLINCVRALPTGGEGESMFVSRPAFGRVMAVLVPALFYVAAMAYLGLYVSSTLFIAAFMMFFGGYAVSQALAVGVGVPLVLFVMFERWFLVALPKGPLERMLGY